MKKKTKKKIPPLPISKEERELTELLTRPGIRIYRIKSYCNRPWQAYRGDQSLGTFQTIEAILERYPDAVYKGKPK